MTSVIRVGMSVALVSSALVLFGFNRAAAAELGFNGAWACSSSLDHSPIGDGNGSITSLLRMVIVGTSVHGQGIARFEVDGDEDEAETESAGIVTNLGNGFIDILSSVSVEGADPIRTRVRCLGMSRVFGIYHEMHCIDRTEKGVGNGQVSLAICKRQ